MTLIGIQASRSIAHPPSDAPPRHFPSSRPSLWLNTGSMESLPNRLTNITTISPTLRKRHSTHALSSSPEPPPTNPPPRPRHLPRRGGGVPVTPAKSKAKKRPSTAPGDDLVDSSANDNNSLGSSSPVSTRTHSSSVGTGSAEQVIPWALHPIQPTTSHHALSTGPAEEVTPWETYPLSKPTRNLSSLNTGLVEDVTPWEMFPGPRPEEHVNHDRKSNKKHSRSSVSRDFSDTDCLRFERQLVM
jgi:hypothetical protein